MNDTTPEIEMKMRELIAQKTPQERLEMGSSMFDTSVFLIKRFILQENPNISEVEMKQQLFLKLYRDDFTPEQIEKIFKYFQRSLPDQPSLVRSVEK